MKWTEKSSTNSICNVAAVDQILLAEREEIPAVCTPRDRSQTNRKLGHKMIEQIAISFRGRVVEFIDDTLPSLAHISR